VKRILILMGVAAIGLVASAVALGGSSSTILGQYAGVGGEVQQSVPLGTQAVHTSGTLPFTGLDLALVAAGAILLLVTGWALRRAGRNRA
jgi:hypothetical protein